MNIPRVLTATVLLTLAPGLATSLWAQERTLALSVPVTIPVGDFGDNVDAGFGVLGFTFAYGVGSTPISVGADAMWALHYTERAGGENIDVQSYPVHFFVRAQLRDGAVRPYVEGLVGFRYMAASGPAVEFCVVGVFDAVCHVETNRYFTESTHSFGGGGGAYIALGDSFFLDVRVRFLAGGTTAYPIKGSFRVDDDVLYFDVAQSSTHMVVPQIGFGWRF